MSGGVYEVTMPKLGETVTEGVVSQWLKQPGDPVAFDDPLFEVSTDKVDSEVPSPYDGVLLEILVNEGDTVAIGTTVARIGEPAAAAAPPSGNGRPGVPLSPVVRRLASEHGIDLATLPGSGAGGRIRREDVQQAIAARPAAAPAVTAAPEQAASPARGEEIVKLSRMRLITADLMVRSLKTSAHVWTSVEVDFERVEQIRQRHREQFRKTEGVSLTYLPFVARAVCDALREYPAVNASIDIENQTMTLHHFVHLGIAVDLSEQGLVAPVVKNADSLNVRGLARGIATVAAGARARTLGAGDLSGSTFTITNPGPFASYASAPVINQPNVAILSTEGIARRPVAVGDAIAIHHMSILGFSYDHRAFDGSTASLFLRYVRDAIQDRAWDAEFS